MTGKPNLGIERLRAEILQDQMNPQEPKACINYLQCEFPSACSSASSCKKLERNLKGNVVNTPTPVTQLDAPALEAATMALLGKTANEVPDVDWYARREGNVTQWRERTYYAITTYLSTVATPIDTQEREPYGYLWFTKHMERRFTHNKPTQGYIGEIKPVYE